MTIIRDAATCPDCGEPIELTDSRAWWRHLGIDKDCWRLSMDGPNDPDAPSGKED